MDKQIFPAAMMGTIFFIVIAYSITQLDLTIFYAYCTLFLNERAQFCDTDV